MQAELGACSGVVHAPAKTNVLSFHVKDSEKIPWNSFIQICSKN